MLDFARSDDPRVQAQLDRLAALSVPDGRLGLETIRAMMDRLGNPHRKLPPAFHVAGTNGKGSVCAFLRAMLEADGKRVHVTTSPHLVRYNERIRLAGELISDEALAELLAEVLDACEDLNPSFFEVTIASAFLAFSRTPADACVVEVGLGGRFDATNVLEPEAVAVCGIAALGIDHERFLLAPEEGVPKEPMARIAFEKAGIAKRGVPLVTFDYGSLENAAVAEVALKHGAQISRQDISWAATFEAQMMEYQDSVGSLSLPLPGMQGMHQWENAALATAMIRHQSRLRLSQNALAVGIEEARWPARMQCLVTQGKLLKASGFKDVWLDGGHNYSAGEQIAKYFDGPLHLVIGMIEGKDPKAITGPLGDWVRTLTVVPVPGHKSHHAEAFGPTARSAAGVEEALLNLPSDDYSVLIAGSLYLAGEVLRLNDEVPR